MSDSPRPLDPEERREETLEWLESLDYILQTQGPERVRELIKDLQVHALQNGVTLPFSANTPYINTIPLEREPLYPGNREIERRIKSLIRWNAMAMVVRANREQEGIGGHISTYASAATLYEVAFNHFFRGKEHPCGGDLVYIQGHASPGIYARAFLEGRFTEEHLNNFRRELRGPGLSSYPHPWLMPDFWEFPTVSMGLGPIMAIYQARFLRYLEDRGLTEQKGRKVWAFLGDGETDEPEALGAISLAAREHLDNLVFVINCNLQRLDGPVRGNGQIIQELEADFRGTGWNVLKVIWGSDWDPLLAADSEGLLVKRMGEIVDGEYQKYVVESGDYVRQHFFGADPRLLKMVAHLSDQELDNLRRGGHDPDKVYAAYAAAMAHTGQPTVILAHTIKGYGLGESGEGKNITHQQKKLNEDELREFRTRFGIPISDEDVSAAPFYRPPDDAPEIQYMKRRRAELGGPFPMRRTDVPAVAEPKAETFTEFHAGTDGREISTTMAFVRILAKLLKDPEIGRYVVPIVPDEARTFGMEALFRQVGIYSHPGQLYEPVDADTLLYYKEARDGQILEEGITEAGALSSFIAAGTSYASTGVPTLPFFIFYSMFGMQRVGDLVWAAADMRCRGFLLGATAGRTTLAGEGLQHQDGQSHLLALPVPNLKTYDPAFGYELAVILKDGIRRMMVNGESLFYYLTVMNENYAFPAMPEGAEEGILRGLYKVRPSTQDKMPHRATLMASGAIVNEALKAQTLLEGYGVAADVWSVTSYKELRVDGLACERWNRLHPDQERREPFVRSTMKDAQGPIVVASDYVQALTDGLSRWMPRKPVVHGTFGFGRSESRQALRDFFEVDARHIAFSALASLVRDGALDASAARAAAKELEIRPDRPEPWTV